MNDKERYVLDHYDISKDGKVYSPYTKKFLKYRTDRDGYFDVALIYNEKGDRQPFRIHRLVALKYLKEKSGYNVVNHKDLNKQNNNLNNLEWSTVQLNTKHGYDNCAYKNIHKIKCIEANEEIKVFPSAAHTSRYYGYANSSFINNRIRFKKGAISSGKLKGYYFEITNESVTTIERVNTTASIE